MLLLDEIEKAHPDIFNILLQVMDHATLTDNNGRKADFRNVISDHDHQRRARKRWRRRHRLRADADNAGKGPKAIERLFSPEFRNRLDAIIAFASLSRPVIERIVDKFILELDAQLNERRVFLQLTPAGRNYLAEKGYDPTFGARPMARLIQNEIKRVLADEILFGRLRDGGRVTIDACDGALTFTYAPAGEKPRTVEPTAAATESVD